MTISPPRRNNIAIETQEALNIRAGHASLLLAQVGMAPNADLDQFDLAILAIIQRDNTTPQRVIGAKINLSAPAVQRRIKRMQEAGVIQANVAVVDPVKLGQAITIFVEVEMESERADEVDTAKRAFFAAPEVQQCYYVTGEFDFVLVMLVPNMAAYEALTRRLFFGNNNVKRFRTLVALDRVKVGLSVPLPGS